MTKIYLRWENTANTSSQTSSHDVVWNRCVGWPWAADNLNEKIRSGRARYFGSSSYLIFVSDRMDNSDGQIGWANWRECHEYRIKWMDDVNEMIMYLQNRNSNFTFSDFRNSGHGSVIMWGRMQKCHFYQNAGLWMVYLEFQWSPIPMNIALIRKSPLGNRGDLSCDDSTRTIWIKGLDASF